jgi:Flp pilus assembly protein TadG
LRIDSEIEQMGEFRRSSNGPRAFAIIYVTISLVVLCGIVSLAVDYGRVQVVKAELQQAADASARYATRGIADNTAVAKATSAAQDNYANGSPVVLQAGDVLTGNWDSSLNPKFSTTRTPINAVQVTAVRTSSRGNAVPLVFARVLGPNYCSVQAKSIALLKTGEPGGFIGLDSVTVKNNALIASYDPTTTPNPSQSNKNNNGGLGSNGAVYGKNNNDVYGSVTLGPSGSIIGFTVSGDTVVSATAIPTPTIPTWSPSANPGAVPQSYTVNSNTTLAGGTYWFTSLTINKPLKFSGPATVHVNGDIVVDDDFTAYNDLPSNLTIYQHGVRAFGDDKGNHIKIFGKIVAPQSAFVAKNNAEIRGSATFKSIECKNNADLFCDETLGSVSGGTTIATVE